MQAGPVVLLQNRVDGPRCCRYWRVSLQHSGGRTPGGRSVCVKKIVSTNDHLEMLPLFTGPGDCAALGMQNRRRKLGDFITRMTSMSTPPDHLEILTILGKRGPNDLEAFL